MIYVPKYTHVEVELPKVHAEYEGWFTFETFRAVEFPKGSGIAFEIAGTRRRRAHFKNVITNQGFDYVSTNGNFASEVAVGTGNTPESVNDTTLQFFVAGTANDTSSPFTAEGTPPYYGSQTWTWRFGEGEAAGILAEAGIGSDNTNVDGSDLWSRALIKDGAGDPTTVEVTANEWLDVSYQLRLYPGHLSDDTGSFLIQPSGTSHNYVLRNTLVTSGNLWGAYLQSAFPTNSGAGNSQGAVYSGDAALQDVTLGPSASESDGWTSSRQVGNYVPGSLQFNQDCTWNLGLIDGNLTGGIGAVTFYTNVGCIQMSVDPVFDKDEFKIFDFTVNWSWGNRVTIP